MPRLNSVPALVVLSIIYLPLPLTVWAEDLTLLGVVVITRKREESLRSPRRRLGFYGRDDGSPWHQEHAGLEGLVPGLNLGGGGNGVKGDGNAYIRGVGQRETQVTTDSGVGIYLDEVYIGRASGALLDAIEPKASRCCVARRARCSAKTPPGARFVYLDQTCRGVRRHRQGTFGNLDRKDASPAVNVPLIEDTLLSRLSMATINRDGYIENDWTAPSTVMKKET